MSERERWSASVILAATVVLVGAGGAYGAEGLRIPLTVRNGSAAPLPQMPYWTGVPLPRGAVKEAAVLRLADDAGTPVPGQFDVQARWLDGSVKWVLVSFLAGVEPQKTRRFVLTDDASAEAAKPARAVSVFADVNNWDVTAGPLKFRLNRHGFCGVSQGWLDINADGNFESEEMIVQEDPSAGIVATDAKGNVYTARQGRVSAVDVERSGPIHAVVAVRGDLRTEGGKEPLLDYTMRFHAFAGSSLVRAVLTVHNPRAAGRSQDGGRWELGQAGAVFLKSLEFVLPVRLPEGHRRVSLSAEPGKLLDRIPLAGPMGVYQDSSGGENWFARTHVNRDNVIPLEFRGYRVSYRGKEIASGLRATPWVDVSDMRWAVGLAVPDFWQNFPKALAVDDNGTIRLGLWPKQSADLHEIQGGEQKTHEFWLYFHHRRGTGRGGMPFDRQMLPACLDRPVAMASAEAYAAAGALDPILPVQPDRFARYEVLMAAAVRAQRNLYTHIEQQDEYGWRDFGDTPAYNERDQTQGPYAGLICCSHYNNEYDLGLGMLTQALRTADTDPPLARAWWDLAIHALWHEADIDIYHTKEEPYPMYAGGTFTHTAHGVDAGRSTHRASPADEMYGRLEWPWGRGGAPESGHLRSRGILAAWLATGDRHLLEATRDVADCVAFKVGNNKFAQIDIPDRCAGNNLQILLDGWLLDGQTKYLDLCEKIVANLDVAALRKRSGDKPPSALDWSGALYVKSLGRFIEALAEKGVRHEAAIAQHLEYSRLIRQPYDRRGRWNSGPWSMLMSEVMMQAAGLAKDPAEKRIFLDAGGAAFHACDAWVSPDGTAGFFNSKTLTMLLQGGGLYMRHALGAGLEPATTQPFVRPATQPASGPSSQPATGPSSRPRRGFRPPDDPFDPSRQYD